MRLDAINFRDGSTWTSLKDLIYPVGSIFMRADKTDNPGSVIGGTWAQIQGRFLLGASSSYAIKSTGGAATHTLTINEIPSHNHSLENLDSMISTTAGWSPQSGVGDRLYYGRYASARSINEFIGTNTANRGGAKPTAICLLIKSWLFGKGLLSFPFGGVVA